MALDPELRTRIESLVRSHDYVLFMKGTRRMPQCGFSSSIVDVLDEYLSDYATVNILSDPQIRDGVKEYSEWPTIPQFFVKGEFVGGGDIVKELAASGELGKVLGAQRQELKIPTVVVTEAAAAMFRGALAEAPNDFVHFRVGPKGMYDLTLGPRGELDVEVPAGPITLLLDRGSARKADGLRIDYQKGPSGEGFRIDNPNVPTVKAMSSPELKAKLDAGEALVVWDVRTDAERAAAKLPFARHLNESGQAELEKMSKDTPLVFHCHHGMRSKQAADHFLSQGFTKVWNLTGGIDAWSQQVDSTIPRY